MKLNEFIKKNFESFKNEGDLKGKELEKMIPALLTLDDFKDIKKINVLQFPCFSSDLDGNPVDDSYLGETKAHNSVMIKYGEETCFNNIIDLYSISLICNPDLTKIKNDLNEGVWLTPNVYNEIDFSPSRELLIKFRNMNYTEDDVNVWLEKAKELLLSKESNIPKEYMIFFRVSERSIKPNKSRELKDTIVKTNLEIKKDMFSQFIKN